MAMLVPKARAKHFLVQTGQDDMGGYDDEEVGDGSHVKKQGGDYMDMGDMGDYMDMAAMRAQVEKYKRLAAKKKKKGSKENCC